MKLEVVADRRLHPATFAIRAIRSLPQYVLGLPALVGVMSDVQFHVLILAASGGILAALAAGYLHWSRFRYGIGGREIVIESGILHRQRRVIPFDRIQDIDIEQGPLARLFGTAKVKIETGGSAKNEGNLDSVALDEAHRLREILRRGRDGADLDQENPPLAIGPAPVGLAADEPDVFRMGLKRLLLAGLFNFSLVYLAVIFGGLQYVEALFGIDPWSLDWIGPARSIAASATWAVTLLAAVLILILGMIVELARTVARDFNFTLARTATGFRRRRGLFTLSEVMIPQRRIQLASVRSGLVARQFGWFSLQFQTLNADAAKSGHQVAAPFARMTEVLTILEVAQIAPPPPDEAFTRISKRHIIRQSLRWLTVLTIALIAASFFWRPALVLLPALPFAIGAAALQWRHHRYAMGPAALYIRQGWFSRNLWIIPYEKIQSVTVGQGPLQRRLSLASLAVDTAGASLMNAPHIINLPAADAPLLAERLVAELGKARSRLGKPALDSLRMERAGITAIEA